MASALETRHHQVLSTANSRLQRAADTSLWDAMRFEAQLKAQNEPILGSYFHATILNHRSFRSALSFRIASRLDTPMLPTMMIRDVIEEALDDAPHILTSAEIDILATYT
jgi:serine O-acetyltransferase